MSTNSEQYVQVATDGSGKKVQNRERVIVKADGSEHVVEAQVVVLSGPDGGLFDPEALVRRLESLEEAVELLAHLLRRVLSTDTRQAHCAKANPTPAGGRPTYDDLARG